MVSAGKIEATISLPEEINSVNVKDSTVTIKGKLGELAKDFKHTGLEITKVKDTIVLRTYFPRRKNKALLHTVRSHLNNMINGVIYGYEYRMKIVFSHFPIRVNPDMKKGVVKIENLYGGRKPRYANIVGDVKVKVKDEDVVVTGSNKEHVGQTCANIQELTRQRGKRRQSPQRFMDGIFVFERGLKSA